MSAAVVRIECSAGFETQQAALAPEASGDVLDQQLLEGADRLKVRGETIDHRAELLAMLAPFDDGDARIGCEDAVLERVEPRVGLALFGTRSGRLLRIAAVGFGLARRGGFRRRRGCYIGRKFGRCGHLDNDDLLWDRYYHSSIAAPLVILKQARRALLKNLGRASVSNVTTAPGRHLLDVEVPRSHSGADCGMRIMMRYRDSSAARFALTSE